MSEPTPLQDLMVNDRYWLQRARGMLDAGIRGRDEAAARLASGVGWLWTVYTGVALVGVALVDRPLSGVTVGLLVLPTVLLVAAYALAVWAGLPLDAEFDPRVVEEIQAVHEQATREKQRRLRWAWLGAGAGAVTVIVAVVATATVRDGRLDPSLSAVVQRQERNLALVLVHGQFPAGQEVTFTVTSVRDGRQWSELDVADAAGVARESFPVPETGEYQVRAAWSHEQQDWTLTVRTAPVPMRSPSGPVTP